MMRHLVYRTRPSLLAFLLRALCPSPGLHRGVPALSARWRHRVAAAELERFCALTGLPAGDDLPLLYPHTIGFPLQMAILTQPSFPLPIWRILQVRNRILQRQPLSRQAELDFSVRLAGHRILDKGVEFDLYTRVAAAGACAWESVNTFYVRGRFGAPTAHDVPRSPKVSSAEAVRWRMPRGGGWHFSGLSGDYNPLHLWSGYARRRGYAAAFLHPPRALGPCLARLLRARPQLPLRLETWIKGPVFYGARVEMRSDSGADGSVFTLYVEGEPRPALVGRLCPGGGDDLEKEI